MSRLVLVLFAHLLASCTSVRTFDMTWTLTNKGTCAGAGLHGIDPRYAGEQEVTLRYAKAPNHYVIICSNKLATVLRTGGRPIVPMVERRNGGHGSSTSICEIAGLKDDAPGAACTFWGQVRGGFENDAKPAPWDD
jgi:hypothetical protein